MLFTFSHHRDPQSRVCEDPPSEILTHHHVDSIQPFPCPAHTFELLNPVPSASLIPDIPTPKGLYPQPHLWNRRCPPSSCHLSIPQRKSGDVFQLDPPWIWCRGDAVGELEELEEEEDHETWQEMWRESLKLDPSRLRCE